MKRIRKPSMFLHAAKMLWRNKRSYLMLSVTIVLSFSLLLGYLVFVDSQMYNRYAKLMAAEQNIVLTYTWENVPTDSGELATWAKNVDPSVQLYQYYSLTAKLQQFPGLNVDVYFLPEGGQPYYQGDGGGENLYQFATRAYPIEGKSDFALSGNEAIVSEALFRLISPDGTLPAKLVVPLDVEESKNKVYIALDVVGVSEEYSSISYKEDGTFSGQPSVYVSQSVLEEYTPSYDQYAICRYTWMSTDYPQQMAEHARGLRMVVYSAAAAQESARTQMKAQAQTKGIIAIALLLLLGINLYSSFSNALERRKYEIGVKRAIGASGWSIMRQFMAESMLVMLANILISVMVVADVLIGYKLFRILAEQGEVYRSKTWIVDISGYSLAMFAVCSVTLTVVFSLLFAYKSTKVEIVQYLKAE